MGVGGGTLYQPELWYPSEGGREGGWEGGVGGGTFGERIGKVEGGLYRGRR